ncbi:ankyrin repeat domain-containing protein [Costertonia aggregata]|uniref:PD40 domain-containing protein n=1 Tax=Costertonia aggregata TaxID=343403 RepID=A0A7H9AKW3_9FLAO|nr:ankyrin repeat domain-containing protein [Costertonia aggregata]QLG44111.1 PD40 domain-containing protein [Costertonia aggregata]
MKKITYIIIFLVIALKVTAQNIHRTACQGNLIRLDSMLSNTVINVKDHRGRSLLHWAVACKKEKVFDFLIQRGVDVNGEDNQNKTPMHIAAQYSNEEYFDKLVQSQRNSDWKNKYGASLLEIAVLKKDTAFIKRLINNDININSKNDRGSSSLEISQRIKATTISNYLLANGADENGVRKIEAEGLFMGQSTPGRIPKMFAPNFISTEEYEFGSVFNANNTEFYFGVDVNGKNEIRYSKLTEGTWSKPKTILSHDRYGYNDPFLSPDEKRLYFISNRALDGTSEVKDDIDIWFVEKNNNVWSQPIHTGPNINSDGNEYYISFTKDGTMYFSSSRNAPAERKNHDQDIYYSKFVDEQFQKAVGLGSSINTKDYEADVFIDPEENYIIFCSTRANGFGRGDLYISFKDANGAWTKSMNMGETINTKNHELCPFVTLDGKFLFYTSNEDIYWVNTDIISELRGKSK